MDEFTAEILAESRDEAHEQQPDRSNQRAAASELDPSTASPPHKSGLRGGLAALREKANIQDRLVEKLLAQVIPTDDAAGPEVSISAEDAAFPQRPNFNLTTMSNNFRRFNARIGVVFKFQARMTRILSWRHPSHTLSLLAAYTFVCLDPYLLSVLPIIGLILGAFIPGFIARHPAPPKGTLSSEQSLGYSPRGPPLAPAATVRPAKELSKDFFRNMRDLQNSMDDFTQGHDVVVALLVPISNFSNEALSSAVFLFLFVGGIFMTIAAHIIPWRFVFLIGGWAAIGSGHPAVIRLLTATREEHIQPREKKAKSWMDDWIATDVILDSAPETREVEIFELQRASSGTGEWEPWVFCPSPYDPLSQPRIAGERPRGTRFFEDVMPPDGWQWSEKKWALDLWSRDWVEERIITGVEVETEGERWVYDIYNEREERTGVVDHQAEKGKVRAVSMPQTSWEEGEDGTDRRGEWRRRRWVRLVKRRVAAAVPGS